MKSTSLGKAKLVVAAALAGGLALGLSPAPASAAPAAPVVGMNGWFCVWTAANYAGGQDCGRQVEFNVPYKINSFANHTGGTWSINFYQGNPYQHGRLLTCLTEPNGYQSKGPYTGQGNDTLMKPGTCF